MVFVCLSSVPLRASNLGVSRLAEFAFNLHLKLERRRKSLPNFHKQETVKELVTQGIKRATTKQCESRHVTTYYEYYKMLLIYETLGILSYLDEMKIILQLSNYDFNKQTHHYVLHVRTLFSRPHSILGCKTPTGYLNMKSQSYLTSGYVRPDVRRNIRTGSDGNHYLNHGINR